MKTVAVVLNWKRADDTLRCVASLLAIDRDLDVVVVDNASGDDSLARIAAGLEAHAAGATVVLAAPDQAEAWPAAGRAVLLVDSGRNGGYAFGNNIGIWLALARPDAAFVWVLNNDTVVPDAATLDALLARMAEDATIGICGATVVYGDHPDRVQTLSGGSFDARLGRCHPIGFGTTRDDPVDRAAVERALAYVNGAAAFVRRGFIEQIGPMTEDYFLYFEEFDWAARARGRFRLGFAPDAVVLHEVGATIGTDDFGGASPLSTFYLTRNRLRFLGRFSRRSVPPAILDIFLEGAREAQRGRWQNVASIGRAVVGLPFKGSAK